MWLMLAAIRKIASSERTELRCAGKKGTSPDFCTPDTSRRMRLASTKAILFEAILSAQMTYLSSCTDDQQTDLHHCKASFNFTVHLETTFIRCMDGCTKFASRRLNPHKRERSIPLQRTGICIEMRSAVCMSTRTFPYVRLPNKWKSASDSQLRMPYSCA